MTVESSRAGLLPGRVIIAVCTVLLSGVFCLTLPHEASAYIGDSFLNIPGSPGHWQEAGYKNWIRAETSQWEGVQERSSSTRGNVLAGDKMWFSGPDAVRPGTPGKLAISLSKTNPDFAQLMDKCVNKTAIPEMTYAESVDRSRPPLDLGPKPPQAPEYWEYKLKDVQVVDCPVVEGAVDQAFVLGFNNIEWLNFDPNNRDAIHVDVKLPNIKPAEPSSRTKTKVFVVSWIAPATTGSDELCPAWNKKPSEDDYYHYVSKDDADKERAKYGEKGVTYGPQMEMRGPHKLNVEMLPGIIPDPGLHEPKGNVAEGLNLDNDDGSGSPPAGTCKHANFTSPDGRTGIDNQYFRVTGCVTGYSGRKGYRYQTSNARRADGNITTLIEISNIHDEKNDDHVDVTIIHAMDKPIRDAAGKYLPNSTFRPTDNPNYAYYNVRLHGRIVNGVITTEPVRNFSMNLGQDPQFDLADARLRLEILPDGSMKGTLGGYGDWKKLATLTTGYSEGLFNYQAPALYYAYKRYADGLKDPVTGECNGISEAYDIDAVPAFLTPAAPKLSKTAENTTNINKTQ